MVHCHSPGPSMPESPERPSRHKSDATAQIPHRIKPELPIHTELRGAPRALELSSDPPITLGPRPAPGPTVAEGHHQPDSVGSAGVPVQDTARLLQGERGGRDLPFQVPGGYPRRVGDELWGRGDRREGAGPTAPGAASPGWWGAGGSQDLITPAGAPAPRVWPGAPLPGPLLTQAEAGLGPAQHHQEQQPEARLPGGEPHNGLQRTHRPASTPTAWGWSGYLGPHPSPHTPWAWRSWLVRLPHWPRAGKT